MKTLIIFVVLFLIYLGGHAQTFSPKVNPASGGYSSGAVGSLSWTIGETHTATLQGGTSLLSQGEQQAEIGIQIGTLSGNAFCAGALVSVPFIARGYYGSSNVFTAQLSNSSGSFASSVIIGTLNATGSGTIAATIPLNTIPGTGYRIRVISNIPTFIGKDNGTNISINVNPTASSSVTAPISCNGQSGVITVAGNGGLSPYSGTGSNTVTVGTYSFTVTDANGCKATTSQSISQPTIVTFISVATNVSVCGPLGSIAVTASGGIRIKTYSKDNGSTFQSGLLLGNLGVGTYPVLVKDANGCLSASANVAIAQSAPITYSTVVANVSGCGSTNNGFIQVTATGGIGTLTYSKNNGTTYQSASLLNNLSAGTYAVKVKDVVGCVSTSTAIIISTNPGVTFTSSVLDATSCTTANGKITIVATGGSSYYNYSKNGGTIWQGSSIFNSLAHGTYPVKVKDILGCMSNVVYVTVGPGCREGEVVSLQTNDAFNVYPNPTDGIINICFSSADEKDYNLKLVDIFGRIVINENHSAAIGNNQYQINLENIAEGVYFLEIQKGDNTWQKKIMVVQ